MSNKFHTLYKVRYSSNGMQFSEFYTGNDNLIILLKQVHEKCIPLKVLECKKYN